MKRFVLYRTYMMNDPDSTLYRLYVKRSPEIKLLEDLNLKVRIDEQPAPENPQLMHRSWTHKKDAEGNETKRDKANTVKFMHWNVLADKLTQSFDRVPNKYLDWRYRWKLIQQ